jgi:pre-mRNA-splicing factor ATP-dependent RNA helicase DHX38/PRP16
MFHKFEQKLDETKLKITQPVSKKTANSADHDKWEINRMITSGAIKMLENSANEVMEDEEKRVIVMTHDIKPPFLDGRIVFTRQIEPVQVVKDPTSDIARLSKKGSAILKFIRERNDRSKMRERFWELAGSKLGNILKLEKKVEVAEEAKITAEGNVDYKADSQYGSAIKKKIQAVSDFAKSKTMEEQREYLPIYSCRGELLKEIRQNKMYFLSSSLFT